MSTELKKAKRDYETTCGGFNFEGHRAHGVEYKGGGVRTRRIPGQVSATRERKVERKNTNVWGLCCLKFRDRWRLFRCMAKHVCNELNELEKTSDYPCDKFGQEWAKLRNSMIHTVCSSSDFVWQTDVISGAGRCTLHGIKIHHQLVKI